MKKKIFKQSLTLTVVALLLTVLLMGAVIFSQLQQRFFADLKNEATALTKVWEKSGATGLEHVVSTDRLTLVAEDGTVLMDNQAPIATMANHNARPEIIAARKNGSGQSQRESDTLLSKNFYYAVRLTGGHVLRVSTTEESFMALYVRFAWPLLGIFIIAAALAYVFARRVAKQLVAPLNALNLNDPRQTSTYPELTPLVERLEAQNNKIAQQMRNIQAKERQLTLITDNMKEGILLLDAKNTLLVANPVAREVLSLPADPATLLPDLFKNQPEILAALAPSEKKPAQEVTFKEGGRLYRLSVNAIFEGAEFVGTVLLLFDITDNATQEALRREFTANVTHELKTPLTSISGYAEIIHAGIVKKADIPNFAQRIYDEAQRLIALVNDILHLSKLEGQETRVRAAVNWPELVGQMQKTLALPLAEKNQQLTVHYQGDTSYQGYPSVLQDSLYNLLENAHKYSGPHTTIELDIAAHPGEVTLTVSDAGPGIPLAERERIFERFYRIDKSHSPQIPGTGLGLAIVKHGVQLHHGRIDITTNPAGGTTFIVHLPIEN
ncbi:sensor histidine kinase [Enterococcus timonensis]|uniref:sensor histidine kinase n=1 Tax=Enterococcus timonensis TaxID=1852364 RepID=UPI0008DB2960|nr:ATP-binding protein [Enterococcus timonensis]